MIEYLTATPDPRVSDYFGLTDTALRSRRELAEGLFIAESFNVIERALTAGYTPRSLLVTEKWLPRVEALSEQFGLTRVPIFVGAEEAVQAITGFHVHRGALAAMERRPLPQLADLLHSAHRILVLEDLVDHTNVGAAIRSAAGIGMDAVVVSPRCADPLYRRAIRVSMGTVFQIPWTRSPVWPVTTALSDLGFTTAALALRADAEDLASFAHSSLVADPESRIALIVGPEGHGLDQRSIASADKVVMIPMGNGVDSLNVAAAAAVGCWAIKHA